MERRGGPLTLILVGLSIGLGLQFFWRNPPAQSLARQTVEAARTASQGSPVAPVNRQEGRAQEAPPAPVSPARVNEPKAVAATVSASPKPITERSWSLVEDEIAEMESFWDQLPSYAYTTQNERGWKIHILPEDRVFLKSGLTSGDWITFESMDGQLQAPGRAELATRMIAILNLIRR